MVFISKLILKRDGIIKIINILKASKGEKAMKVKPKTTKINSNVSIPIMDINGINTPVEKLAFWVC